MRFADPPIENLATFTPSTYRERYQKFDKERDVSPWFNESSPITILNKKRKPILLMRDFPSFGASESKVVQPWFTEVIDNLAKHKKNFPITLTDEHSRASLGTR